MTKLNPYSLVSHYQQLAPEEKTKDFLLNLITFHNGEWVKMIELVERIIYSEK